MGSPNSSSDVTHDDVRSQFTRADRPSKPRTVDGVAEAVGCTQQTAEQFLMELTTRGELQTTELDDEMQVWWRRADASTADPQIEQDEFRAFVSSVQDYAIFTLDPDGVVVNWNDGAERIKGYTENEIVGEHFSIFYTNEDDDSGVPEENLEKAAADGRVEDEGWRLRADGSRFWANVVITAVRDDDGELKGFTKVTRDMTEQRAYEQQLRQERDLIEQIFETAPISIGVLDADGQFRRANPRMLERHGIDESRLSEYNLSSLEVFDDDEEPIPEEEWPFRQVVETDEPVYDFECQMEFSHGERRWISINAAPLESGPEDAEQIVAAVADITDQKERERSLRRERDQTEQLLRTAPIAIAVQNADGDTVMANQRAQDALGLSEQEIIDEPEISEGWNLFDGDGNPISPDETPSARVHATGEAVFDEELIIEPPDGDRMYFHINATPIFDSDGALSRVIMAGEDITELKNREAELERRKEELETELGEILDRISDAFYALDDEWRFTHLNDYAAELMQWSRAELLDRVIWDVFPDAAGVYRENFEKAMETQKPVTFEVFGDDIDAWLGFNVYPSESGLSIYFRDITERKRRERALAKYETIVETVNDGIYMKDDDGYFTMVNEGYADLTGYEREELVGEHASMVVDESTMEDADEMNAMGPDDDGANPTMEAMIETADDEQVPTEATFATIETADDEQVPTEATFATIETNSGSEQVGVVRDITDRKEYERKLEESNERLEQFAYAASHDLQEPLRMITSYLQLIERRYADDLDESGREFIEFAVDGAERMREMIEALLEYSRVETRGNRFESVDLDAVLADVREDLQFQIEESDAEITADSLPTVMGDPSQIRQVFQNLVDNAIKYSGDEPPRIHIDAERKGARLELAIQDNGIGIEPSDIDRIFQVFQRLHSHEEHPGTGIGLALCRRIVERHDGDMWVDSEPGDGTTVYLTLPAAAKR